MVQVLLFTSPNFRGTITATPSGKAYHVEPGQTIVAEDVDVPLLLSYGFSPAAPNANPGGGGNILQFSVLISKEAVTTLLSSPVDVGIPAPGVGKAIMFLGGLVQYKPGASNYSGGQQGIQLIYEGGDPTSGSDNAGFNSAIIGSGSVWGGLALDLQTASPSAYANKKLMVATGTDFGVVGPITSSVLNDGGSGYTVNDTFTVDGPTTPATGTVNTVDGGGAVLTYTLNTAGQSYVTEAGATTTATTGDGTGLVLDIIVSVLETGPIQVDGTYTIIDVVV